MSTCQEPTGIGARENFEACGDPAGVFCDKCPLLLCEHHLEVHKHRHQVLDKLKDNRSTKSSPQKEKSDEW